MDIENTGSSTSTYYGGLTPAAAGWKDWNIPAYLAGSNSINLVSGTIYGMKVPTAGLAGAGLTKIGFAVPTVGATLSGSKVGAYSIPTGTTTGTGSKLVEAAADTAFTTVNWNEVALAVAAASLTPFIYIAFMALGTTGPQLLRSPSGTGSHIAMNKAATNQLAGCVLGNLTVQSALPATIDYSANANTQFVTPIVLA